MDGKNPLKAKTSTSDDKNQSTSTQSQSSAAKSETKGVPFYDYTFGLLRFNRHFPEPEDEKVVFETQKERKNNNFNSLLN